MAAPTPKSIVKRAKADLYRSLILDSAEVVFASSAFDDAKIQDIAHKAGIALGTLYTVFESKLEIYDAIQKLRGREILEGITRAVQGHDDILDAAAHGIDAYVRCMAERPNYLRMHLRDGLSWTDRAVLKTGTQVSTWEQGTAFAVVLIRNGIERGLLYADNRPEVLLNMMIATHQVQLRDWLDRGASKSEVEPLIKRMQDYFVRSFVKAPRRATESKEKVRKRA